MRTRTEKRREITENLPNNIKNQKIRFLRKRVNFLDFKPKSLSNWQKKNDNSYGWAWKLGHSGVVQ
jgi:hypothetical protein